MNDENEIPFRISRAVRETLVDQVANGLRSCILSGRYKPGDILPTTRALASALGVSHIVTRGAVRILADAGMISPRRSIGCVVLGGRGKIWNGRVLLVLRSRGIGYYENVFTMALRELLVKAGWMVTTTAVNSVDSPGDVSGLEIQLSHPTDLVISVFDNPAAERVLSRMSTPYIGLGDRKSGKTGNCIGYIHYDRAAGATAFASECRRLGIRNVEEVGFGKFNDTVAALKAEGISVATRVISGPCTDGLDGPEPYALAAKEYFTARLAEFGKNFPDLFYFSDDYLCRGAMAAFSAAGLRVPGDVRVASWRNRGNAPVCACTMAGIEIDAVEDAGKVFASALSYLKGGNFLPVELKSVYRGGESIGG